MGSTGQSGKKALPGEVITFSDHVSCEVLDKTDFGGRRVKFQYDGEWDALLDQIGEMPTPPYIHEKLEDKSQYQTVYAKYKARQQRRQRGSILRRS